MNLYKTLLSFYSPYLPKYLAYMLQSVEYQARPFLVWVWRSSDLTTVMRRRTLVMTKPAKLLLLISAALCVLCISLSLYILWQADFVLKGWVERAAIGILVSYPLVVAHLLVIPLFLGRWLIIGPAQQKRIAASEKLFASFKGKKIAVMGSFGKTSMKEMLATVLGAEFTVAKTPANLNVPISHARWIEKVDPKTEVLIIEYGEGQPGDIAQFAKVTHPTHAIITGIAPAHLDHYKTLQAVVEDFVSIQNYVESGQTIYNHGTAAQLAAAMPDAHSFGASGDVFGWQIHDVEVSIKGTAFGMQKGKERMRITSALLGEHQVAPLAFCAAFGRELGMTKESVLKGVAAIVPHEHRMQPRMVSGAWVIDDTYNGNIEGIKAGCRLLKQLPAVRKMYVSPGLVDQGKETKNVHIEMGKAIATSDADKVVLMKNSVTDFIMQGLQEGGYSGTVDIETNPLLFYTLLEQRVAVGDLVLMQNDWTDNYA